MEQVGPSAGRHVITDFFEVGKIFATLIANVQDKPAPLILGCGYCPLGVGANKHMKKILYLVSINALWLNHNCLSGEQGLCDLLMHLVFRPQTFVGEQDGAMLKVGVEPPGKVLRVCNSPVVCP